MARVRKVSERLKELRQIEKRIQQELINEIARTAIRNYKHETKTIDTKELVELISENWDFLSKRFKIKTKEVKNEGNTERNGEV